MAYHRLHLGGGGVAHGVGEVEGGGSGIESGARGAREELVRSARGVLKGKFHVLGERARVFGVGADHLDGGVLVDAQLIFEVYGGRGEEDVDAGMHGVLHSLPALVDVLFPATAEGGDGGAADDGCDLTHRFQFPFARGGETRLDDVHAEVLEGFGDVEFFVDVHTAPRRLFAVAQGGVEYDDLSLVCCVHFGS